MDMPGIIFDGTEAPLIDSDNSDYYLEFDKSEEFFSYYDNRIQFYKKAEATARKHKFLRSIYPKYLKEVVGLKTCQIMPGIVSDDKNKIKIEMHHGPILTLFDVCQIVTDHMRANDHPHINTFTVANEVIEQHRLNHVGVMFLCKSAHDKVHDEGLYINSRQKFGDVATFLELFRDGVDKEMRIKISDYIGWSMEHDSTDSDIFNVSETLREWGNNDFDDVIENITF